MAIKSTYKYPLFLPTICDDLFCDHLICNVYLREDIPVARVESCGNLCRVEYSFLEC